MLVFFEPADGCNLPLDLVLAPLPAGKHMWEARDEFTWKQECERVPVARSAFGLAQDGELVKVVPAQSISSEPVQLHDSSDGSNLLTNPAKWEEWCSEMDGFGGLVMLAASFVS